MAERIVVRQSILELIVAEGAKGAALSLLLQKDLLCKMCGTEYESSKSRKEQEYTTRWDAPLCERPKQSLHFLNRIIISFFFRCLHANKSKCHLCRDS